MTLWQEIRELLASDAVLSARMVRLLQDLRDEWAELDRRIKAYDNELLQTRGLTSIPGIRVINATALVAAIGDASAFARRHDLAAELGLTSRQHSTGGKMLGICKRGNRYLRTLLIHGARAALGHFANQRSAVGMWIQGLQSRSHPNIVIVALAAKLARIVWASLRHGRVHEPGYA